MTSDTLGTGSSEGWPRLVFDAPVLRGLDARSRDELAAAGAIKQFRVEDFVFRDGELADSFYVVISGSVRLSALRRGDAEPSVLRVARRGDTFGEEAALPGARRHSSALVEAEALVAEVPVSVFRRVSGRSGADAVADRELRVLRRAATRDLFGTLAISRDLPESDLDMLLDAVREEAFSRSERIHAAGDRADAAFILTHGLVQLQTEDEHRIQVRAYLAPGDLFGEEEVLFGHTRTTTAVALGDCRCLRVPAEALRKLFETQPDLVRRLRRVAADRQALQERVVGAAAARTTQHVFKDLYRMHVARSLLVIDQDSCVRCGHCAWACADVHGGVARLVRRGDKIVTDLRGSEPKSLMVPNSCQHCKNPACMIDCPTGAIGRDPEGEVFIREELCTGCGACAKACPWDNIQLAPRPAGAGTTLSAEIAVKCDLCRDYEAPACVQACPTGSILRVEPAEDFSRVAALFGRGAAKVTSAEPRSLDVWLLPAALGVAIALAGIALRLHAVGFLQPGRAWGLATGYAALLGSLLLFAHAIPKRRLAIWMKPRKKQKLEPPRSRLKRFEQAHVALGLLVVAAVLGHAGPRLSSTPAGALGLSFYLLAALGAFGACMYRLVPRVISRLERRGALPEDLALERDRLFDTLLRHASGRDELVKRLTERVLLPYARMPVGWVLLAISGRTLRVEEQRLRARIDGMLEGRGAERLVGLDELVRTVVELRALPARRVLSAALRGWLPLHLLLTALFLVLLVIHVAARIGV